MKALSIKQPWASLIAHGIKDIENRTWRTKFRGKIYIHASGIRVKSEVLENYISDEMYLDYSRKLKSLGIKKRTAEYLGEQPISSIIGEVDIIDCVINHPSIWAEKTFMYEYDEQVGEKPIGKPIYNWVLANAKLYDKPILNVKGKLSLWETDIDIIECVCCRDKFDAEFMKEDDGGEKFCNVCCAILSPVMAQEAKENK